MNKHIDVEHCIDSGQFKQALGLLETLQPSIWRDTQTLKCLRGLKLANFAGDYAKQLCDEVFEQTLSYGGVRPSSADLKHMLQHLGLILSEAGYHQEAIKIIATLSKQKPHLASLHREHAYVLSNAQEIDGAQQALHQALLLEPLHTQSHAQLARLYCRTGRVEQGCAAYYRALALEPNNRLLLSRLCFWSNYTDSITQRDQYQISQLWRQACEFSKQNENLKNHAYSVADKSKQRLKLAFLSSQLNSSSVLPCLYALLSELKPNDFDLIVYNDKNKVVNDKNKVVTELSKYASVIDTQSLSNEALKSKIKDDKIDVLFDLTGHHANNRLEIFAERSAALQISWLTYPSTTGVQQIDYRLTDRIIDPVGISDAHYSESLARLAHGFLCFDAPPAAPTIKKSDSRSSIRFGSFNSLAKISPRTLDAWASCLHAVDQSTLCLKRKQLDSKQARDFYRRQFELRGVDPSRLIFLSNVPTTQAHLEHYNDIDIALDTSPVNGMATTFEALWMGTPVLSLTGKTSASRVGKKILDAVQLDTFCVNHVSEFSHTADLLARDVPLRQRLNSELRNRLKESDLMNKTQFAADFTNTVKRCWRERCTSKDMASEANNG